MLKLTTKKFFNFIIKFQKRLGNLMLKRILVTKVIAVKPKLVLEAWRDVKYETLQTW